jgi:dephospho-CoA kinase
MARQVLMSFEVLVYTKYAKPSQRLFTRVIVISCPSKLHRERIYHQNLYYASFEYSFYVGCKFESITNLFR